MTEVESNRHNEVEPALAKHADVFACNSEELVRVATAAAINGEVVITDLGGQQIVTSFLLPERIWSHERRRSVTAEYPDPYFTALAEAHKAANIRYSTYHAVSDCPFEFRKDGEFGE